MRTLKRFFSQTSKRSLPVCIVGAGPAGYYTADFLLKAKPHINIDIFESLPTPFGLVRSGVAPDHPEVKLAEHKFIEVSEDPRVRFFGNVEIGRDIQVSELMAHYPITVLCYGATQDRLLGITGENLKNVHSARDFVGWYNAFPNNAHDEYDLSGDSAVIIGNGNVAIDVARVLARPIDTLKTTDISLNATKALEKSNIKHVHIVGRRGPVQASFTTKELRELTKLEGVNVIVNNEEMVLTPSCEEEIKSDRPNARKYQLLQKIAAEKPTNYPKTIHFHFLKAPVSIESDVSSGKVGAVTFQNTKLSGPPGSQKAELTTITKMLKTNLVFRSIGYKSLPIPGIPFNLKEGVIPNFVGRVKDMEGLYTSGWVKRGPTGTIVTTLSDAEETSLTIIDDWNQNKIPQLKKELWDDISPLLKKRIVKVVDWNSWKIIDQAEKAAGEKLNKPRVKMNSVTDMLNLI